MAEGDEKHYHDRAPEWSDCFFCQHNFSPLEQSEINLSAQNAFILQSSIGSFYVLDVYRTSNAPPSLRAPPFFFPNILLSNEKTIT